MKKILIISYFFPPMGGGGVQRTVKFVKYLRDFGFEPVVLTAKPRTYPILDDSLLKEIPDGVSIFRTFSLEPSGCTKRFRAEFAGGSEKTGKRVGMLRKSLAKLLDLFSKLFLIPDAQIGWLPFAMIKGLSVIKREGVEAIYATGNPYSSFLLGRLLSRFSGKPLIVDFRDPWTLSGARKWPNNLRKRIEKRMEKSVLNQAARVISTTDGMTKEIMSSYPTLPASNFVTITNGYDGAEFTALKRNNKRFSEKFTLAFTGTIIDYRDGTTPQDFFMALSEVLNEEPGIRENLKVVFAGKFRESDNESVEKLGLAAVMDLKGYVSHEESISILLKADVLLFFLADTPINKVVFAGKLFEYLGSQKIILAVGPDCLATQLIEELKAGVVIRPGDIKGLKSSLLALYRDFKNGLFQVERPGTEGILKFDRKNLTERLAEVLKEVINK